MFNFLKENFYSNRSSKPNTECITEFKKVKINYMNNVIIVTVNINSLIFFSQIVWKSLKFNDLKVNGQGIFDILIINKTKLDAFFSVVQFCINGFSTSHKLDRNRNGGGTTIHVRENITSKMLTKHKWPDDIKTLFIEI